MVEKKPVILIVEDDLDVAEMLEAYFRVQDYDVYVANYGVDGVESSLTYRPDLVILDIRLPDIDGFVVAKRLRENRRTSNIPIIFLTEKRSRSDRLQGLGLGADDYITKPFDIQELRLRVRNALQRSTFGSISNPVTGLPEGAFVDERLNECLENDGWAILLISLENLDAFREDYGFVASDDVIRAVSLMLRTATKKASGSGDFIGHLNPSTFVVITNPEVVANLKEHARLRLEQSLDYFYPLRDRDTLDNKKNRLSVRMAELIPDQGPYENIDQLKMLLLRTRM